MPSIFRGNREKKYKKDDPIAFLRLYTFEPL